MADFEVVIKGTIMTRLLVGIIAFLIPFCSCSYSCVHDKDHAGPQLPHRSSSI